MHTRADAAALDAADPLAPLRERFVIADPSLIYLDGNSLGRLPAALPARLATLVGHEWGGRLIGSWNDGWLDMATRVGDAIGALVGAAPGQVVVTNSTTVNLFQLAGAALRASGRGELVTDAGNFPTDRYVLAGLAEQLGMTIRLAEPDPEAVAEVVGPETALVSFSHVDYRTGAIADMAAINSVAHAAGARTLWDLSHAAGAVPVELDATGTDLAVGCTYKYLNGGPGAPAFLYVRGDLHEALTPPIQGWFGQRDQFAMGAEFDPVPGIGRFVGGTPHIVGIACVEAGVDVIAEAGIAALRRKSLAQTSLIIDLADAWLSDLGFRVASPRDPARRGSHVALAHPDGYRISRALAEQAGVVVDFRRPDVVRVAVTPAYLAYTEIWDAIARLRELVATGGHLTIDPTPQRVT